MIISQDHTRTETIARITYSGNTLFCSFKEHDEKFRHVVKGQGLGWSEAARAWSRTLNVEMHGAPEHRAAELTAKLINIGFACDVNETVAGMVQSAAWQPEQKCWVRAIGGKFHLRWLGVDENLYNRAKMLPKSAYDTETKSMTVPSLYYAEVAGFAEVHDFQFTKEAMALLEQAKRDYARVLMPEVPMPKPTQKNKRTVAPCNPIRFADVPTHHLVTTTALYQHQIIAVEKLFPLKLGALFMDMGTGKTRCAIELAVRKQQRISKVIWFTPVSLKLTVAEEIAKHTTGEKVYIFNDETGIGDIPIAFWYIVGIESMSSSDRVVMAIHQLIDQDTFVIVDESSYIKGHASKRSMRIAEFCTATRYRLLLTGTPITQGVVDLYAQMRFLSPDILGYNSFYSFANNHLEYSEKYPGMIMRSLRIGELADKINPFVYQIMKDECMDLPEKLYDHIYFGLTQKQEEAYYQAKEEILNGIEEEIPDYIIFQLFTALQQIVSGFWHHNDDWIFFPHRRVNTLKTIIEGIQENEKVIIWCKYIESINQIADALPGCALYYGNLSEKQRNEQLQLFRGSSRFLVATQATGGHGLTLNEAHYHVFYENEFKYSHRVQAEDRSHRIGQTEHVTYIDIISNSGIDRRIRDAIANKADVVKTFRNEVNKRKIVDL